MSEWKPYLKDRLIKQDPLGFVVIVPANAMPATPLVCPVCDFVMRTRDDETSHAELQCCHRCALLWAHARRAEWKQGWRPSADQVKEAEAIRMPLAITFDID